MRIGQVQTEYLNSTQAHLAFSFFKFLCKNNVGCSQGLLSEGADEEPLKQLLDHPTTLTILRHTRSFRKSVNGFIVSD